MAISGLHFLPETIGHLLADRWISVPAYQRPYAWEVDNVDEFWSDLESALADQREYFLGAIVVTPRGTRFDVIDGQQRLVTSSLLIAAIRDELAVLGDDETANFIEQTYLRTFERPVRATRPRMTLGGTDNAFYEQRFLLRAGGEPTNASQRRMLAAFELLRDRVSGLASDEDHAGKLAALNGWIDQLEQNVLVVLVEAASDADAFQIFETLNDRGSPLTIADLLKNYLISTSPASVNEIQDAWEDILNGLGTEIETQDFVTFVRHYWSSVVGATRERDLFRSIRREVPSTISALDLAHNLAESAEPYGAMLDARHPRWAEFDDSTRSALATLLSFQLGQYRPLLMTAIEKFPAAELGQLTAALVNWSLRGILVGGIGGGVTERAYSMAAVGVRDLRLTTAGQVFNQLRPIIPTDEDFRSAFERSAIPRARLAHYVMRSLNRALEGEENPAFEGIQARNPETVSAPILPRRASAVSWRGFAAEEMDRYVARIGNLILRPAKDKWLGLDWDERRENVPPFPVNRGIEGYETWSPETIRYRQQELAALAIRVWPREP